MRLRRVRDRRKDRSRSATVLRNWDTPSHLHSAGLRAFRGHLSNSFLHTRLPVLKGRGIPTLFGQLDRLFLTSNSWQADIPLRHHYRDAGHVPLQKKVPVAEQFWQNIAPRVACEIRLQHSAELSQLTRDISLHFTPNSSMLAGVDGMQWRLFVCVMGELSK